MGRSGCGGQGQIKMRHIGVNIVLGSGMGSRVAQRNLTSWALTDPYVILSHHTALITQPFSAEESSGQIVFQLWILSFQARLLLVLLASLAFYISLVPI